MKLIIIMVAAISLLLPFIKLKKPASKINAVLIHIKWPVRSFEKNHVTEIVYIESVQINYKYNEYTLYKLEPVQQFETGKDIPGTEPYFLFRKCDSLGKYFQTFAAPPVSKPVDSLVFAHRLPEVGNPDTSKNMALSKSTSKGSTKTVKYYFIRHNDETTPDSAFLYFDRSQNDVDCSFSKEIDSINQMKLYSFIMLYKKQFSPSQHKVLPQREILYEFRDLPIKNQDSMKNVFQHFIDSK